MSSDQTTHLQRIIERLPDDPAARNELVGCAYERLRRLAKKIFREDFPSLEHAHETGTILHESIVRLLHALEEVQPANVREFFSFSALQIRRTLLDLARRRHARKEKRFAAEKTDSTRGALPRAAVDAREDPVRLAKWTEFHEKVDELPPDEKEVVDLHWYNGLRQAEVAKLLDIHPKEVSRRWLKARLKLPDWAP